MVVYLSRPIARTVADAVHVLDAIVGLDYNDPQTQTASKYIPYGGYAQFLNKYGLKGKRLGIVRDPFLTFSDKIVQQSFEHHLQTLRCIFELKLCYFCLIQIHALINSASYTQIFRQSGAILIDNLEIANIKTILNPNLSGVATAVLAEFKVSLNSYLKELVSSPVRSLADVIAFNQKFQEAVRIHR